ncbi:hypothetical protein V6N13_101551 [Hibiscus sabdariffa]|uniref:TF-B3 domain-containing protein n=1 Tax=Hibiscus sabdariffa TaxID=183260 RepID=A0ABR2QLN6_9ROSI
MYGTRMWPIDCTVRKKGYKKPVFSGGLWRGFVIGNKLNVGDRISMYKVPDSHYMVEVEKEKPAASNQHGALPFPDLCRRKVNNKRKRVLEAPDAPINVAKPSIKILGAMATELVMQLGKHALIKTLAWTWFYDNPLHMPGETS